VANGTFAVLLDNFSVQQFPFLCSRPEFQTSSSVMRIFDLLNAQADSPADAKLVPCRNRIGTNGSAQYSLQRSLMQISPEGLLVHVFSQTARDTALV
jgi:hypothetical protein